MMTFRIVRKKDAERGVFDRGVLVVVESEEEALGMLPDEEHVLVRNVTQKEAMARTLDQRMLQRSREDEDKRAKRETEARRRFVEALTEQAGARATTTNHAGEKN